MDGHWFSERSCPKQLGAPGQPPQRDRNPRQPPACAFGVPICSTNSSLGASSSIPGSSGARRIGITAGTGAPPGLARSGGERNNGAGAETCGSGCGDDGWGAAGADVTGGDGAWGGVAGGGAGAGEAAGSATGSAVAAGGELSCAAGSGFTSAGIWACSSRGDSSWAPVTAMSRRGDGAASMASSNGEDSIVVPLSD